MELFSLLGVFGLILIIIGVVSKRRSAEEGRKLQDLYYILGGFFLLSYSLFVRDFVFISLQVIFICAASYDFIRLQKKE